MRVMLVRLYLSGYTTLPAVREIGEGLLYIAYMCRETRTQFTICLVLRGVEIVILLVIGTVTTTRLRHRNHSVLTTRSSCKRVDHGRSTAQHSTA